MPRMWEGMLRVCFVACLSVRVFSEVRVDDYLAKCLDSKGQKSEPSRESDLQGECALWKDNSCCTAETARELQTKPYPINWNHCPTPLPDKCRRHFVQDLCFYECSPDKGPWIQKVKMVRNVRNERFVNIPLCASECTTWWNDCKNAHTCLSRWDEGFDWSSGTNKCPSGSTCRPFTEVFGDAKTFCEKVWGGSWAVVPDDQPCMKLNFQGDNPNTRVARLRAEGLVNGQTAPKAHLNEMILLSAMILFVIQY